MKKSKLLILATLLFLSGCEGTYDFDTDVYRRKIVVESFLHPASPIKVTVSWNRPDKAETDIEYIDGAFVQVEEEGLLITSGVTVNGLFSSDVYPVAGKRYRLKVTIEGKPELSATTSIPLPADMHYVTRAKTGSSPFHEYLAVDVSNINNIFTVRTGIHSRTVYIYIILIQ